LVVVVEVVLVLVVPLVPVVSVIDVSVDIVPVVPVIEVSVEVIVVSVEYVVDVSVAAVSVMFVFSSRLQAPSEIASAATMSRTIAFFIWNPLLTVLKSGGIGWTSVGCLPSPPSPCRTDQQVVELVLIDPLEGVWAGIPRARLYESNTGATERKTPRRSGAFLLAEKTRIL
jgi:hypothetical protein